MAIGPTINDIREITSVLSEKIKMDYSNYAFSFLRRRFAFLFEELRVKNTQSFIEGVNNGSIVDDFCYLFPVEEHEMFRDPSFWRTLRVKILSDLNQERLSFWFPELVATEELLSLIIILKEEDLLERSKIYCNVCSEQRKAKIREGKIFSKNLELHKNNFKRLELSSAFEDYFVAENGYTRIASDNWIEQVEFLPGNYFTHLPPPDIGLTLFRNKMLYYNSKLQSEVEMHLCRSLKRGAFLVLGIKEKVSKLNEQDFVLYDSGEQIYRIA